MLDQLPLAGLAVRPQRVVRAHGDDLAPIDVIFTDSLFRKFHFIPDLRPFVLPKLDIVYRFFSP
jgi:hypothetical protein